MPCTEVCPEEVGNQTLKLEHFLSFYCKLYVHAYPPVKKLIFVSAFPDFIINQRTHIRKLLYPFVCHLYCVGLLAQTTSFNFSFLNTSQKASPTILVEMCSIQSS